jgi:DNA segregation ATPase FtsK/SpoIIIE, S-DNA-T family
MAKNTYKSNNFKEPKKEKTSSKWKLDLAFLKDRRVHLAIGFTLLAISLYLLVACVSYLFSGKADQSVIEAIGETGMKNSGLEAENWLGLLGAVVSHYFVFKWFGLSAFFLPPLFFLLGYKVVFRKSLLPISRTFVFALFMMFWLSSFLGYLLLGTEDLSSLGFLSGGIGFELALLANSLIGWGTFIVLILSMGIFVIFFFNITSLSAFKDDFQEKVKEMESTLEETANDLKPDLYEDGNEEELDEDLFAEEEEDDSSEWQVINKEADAPVSREMDLDSKPVIEPQKKDKEPSFEIAIPKGDPVIESEDELEFIVENEGVEEKLGDKMENYDPTLDLGSYKYPPLDLLNEYDTTKIQVSKEELEQNKDRILETLTNFKIGISSIKATIGPTVTLYEIVPEAGVKISKIKNLEDDIALSLSALGIRIIAPIPGKGTIGIEVPNKNREMVSIRSVLSTDKFMKSTMELPVALGKTISNEVFVMDLAKMPHLLMAGATGQGKSVGLNVILASLIYKRHPSQLKFVLVDPKKVELTLFNKLERHFLAKLPNSEEAIITDTTKVIHTLNSLCMEMDQRYDLLKDAGCRNLKEYNTKFISRRLNPEKGHRFLPYIVLVIDELADLIMTAGKEVETPIARLAQLARAIGIHLVVATQRPSVNVITGIIKANFPARLSFRVTSKVDSRTILDTGGAEQLVGMGDMLLSNGSDLIRLQCAFVDTPEIEDVCEYVGGQRGYETAYLLPEFAGDEGSGLGDFDMSERDALFEEAARLIVQHQQGSTSLIQRKLKLGYNRAGRLIDQLEAAGIVGSFEGSKAREVLIQDEMSLEQLLNNLGNRN